MAHREADPTSEPIHLVSLEHEEEIVAFAARSFRGMSSNMQREYRAAGHVDLLLAGQQPPSKNGVYEVPMQEVDDWLSKNPK